MSLESLAFVLLALGILGAHLATLRILTDCKRDLSTNADNFNGVISDMSESMLEVVRIGSDVADQIDNISMGQGVASVAQESAPMDLQSTILGLIGKQFLGSINGDQTEQERTIYEENNKTPESISE